MSSISAFKVQTLLLVCVAACALAGCVKRELIVRGRQGSLIINYDWSKCSIADGGDQPAQMNIHFYTADGTKTFNESADGVKYTGLLSEGAYNMVSYNPNVSNVEFNFLNSYDQAQVSAKPLGNRATEYISQPMSLYGVSFGSLTDENGDKNTINIHTNQTAVLTAEMKPLVKNLTIVIFIWGEYGAVDKLNGGLSGIAQSVSLKTLDVVPASGKSIEFEEMNGENAIEAQRTLENGTVVNGVELKTHISIFGMDPASSHIANLGIDFVNGTHNDSRFYVEAVPENPDDPYTLELNMDIKVIPVGINFYRVEIHNWKEVDGGDVDVSS